MVFLWPHLPARLLQDYSVVRYQAPRRCSRQKSCRVPLWLHPARGVPRWTDPVQNIPLCPFVAASRSSKPRQVPSWATPRPGEHRGDRGSRTKKNKQRNRPMVAGSRTNEMVSVLWLPDPVPKTRRKSRGNITPRETRWGGHSLFSLPDSSYHARTSLSVHKSPRGNMTPRDLVQRSTTGPGGRPLEKKRGRRISIA